MRLYGAFLLPAPFHQPPRKFKHRFSEVYAGGKSVNLTPRRSILLIDEMDIHRGGPNQAPFNHIFSEYKRGGCRTKVSNSIIALNTTVESSASSTINLQRSQND